MTLAVFSAQATYVPMTGKRASFYLSPAKMSHWFTSRNCCYMVVRCLNIPGSHFWARS